MSFTSYLKLQLVDFVDVYKKYYTKTLAATIVLTLVAFAIESILFHYTHFDLQNTKRQISLLSYFFARYSTANGYCLVDLSKTVLLSIITIFSIGLNKVISLNAENKNINLGSIISHCNAKAWSYVIAGLLAGTVADYLLVKLSAMPYFYLAQGGIGKWAYAGLYLVRIYFPLILFSFISYMALSVQKVKFNLKQLLFILFTLWLFNEFAYEFSLFIRTHIFGLIILPFPIDKHYILESILGVPLIAFYFLGYHSAITNSMRLLQQNKNLTSNGD